VVGVCTTSLRALILAYASQRSWEGVWLNRSATAREVKRNRTLSSPVYWILRYIWTYLFKCELITDWYIYCWRKYKDNESFYLTIYTTSTLILNLVILGIGHFMHTNNLFRCQAYIQLYNIKPVTAALTFQLNAYIYRYVTNTDDSSITIVDKLRKQISCYKMTWWKLN